MTNLPSFGGVNDIREAARKALAACAQDEKRGAGAIWPVVSWCASFAAQEMQNGMFQSGEWQSDKESLSYKGFVKRCVTQSGADATLDKDASDSVRNDRRASIARIERGAKLFLAFSWLATVHEVGADYEKRRVPAAWFIDAEKYEPVSIGKDPKPQMLAFVSRNEKATAIVREIEDGKVLTISIRPSETETVIMGTGGSKARGADSNGDGTAPDVSDANVKASADVIASRFARDGGAITGEAADAMESVYAALVASDATWSLLVALRAAHEKAIALPSEDSAAA